MQADLVTEFEAMKGKLIQFFFYIKKNVRLRIICCLLWYIIFAGNHNHYLEGNLYDYFI